jgi:hypothetical protein
MKLVKYFLSDDHVEDGTAIYEQDASISVRRRHMLHHKVQGQRNTITSALVFSVGELEWIHAGVGDFRYVRTSRSSTVITTDARATGQKSFSAFTLDFFGTSIIVAALK